MIDKRTEWWFQDDEESIFDLPNIDPKITKNSYNVPYSLTKKGASINTLFIPTEKQCLSMLADNKFDFVQYFNSLK